MVSLPLENRVYFALPLSCGGIVAIYRSLNHDDLAKLRRQRGRPVAEYGYYVVDFLPPESGIYETLVDLGAPVTAGQPLGRIHFLERPDREPAVVQAASAGLLLATRGPSSVSQGDCVACVAHEVDPATLQ